MSTRDLIMFAMSTLPREYVYSNGKRTDIPVRINSLSVNTYYPPDESAPIPYVGQMEPIVKWIMQTRSENRFDLVILCSKETYSHFYSDQDKETAVQFFSRKISDSLMEDLTVDENLPFSVFETDDQRIRFVLVPMDPSHPMKGIQSTVEYIREWKRNTASETPGNFYLDIHGGFRDMDLIQNAIVSLLRIDEIIPAGVFTGHYNSRKREFIHQDASYAYGMFDFVSAMNEFINYGHGKALKAYLDKAGKRSEEELKVTTAMDAVSRGLELCDPQAYKTGLNSLNTALDALSESAPSELNIFREYIKDSFGDLLSSKTRTVLLIVKRCIEKELFQQALTFIESSMPAEIVEKQLLYYPQTEENLSKLAGIAASNHLYGANPKYIFIDKYYLGGINFFSGESLNKTAELKMAVAEFAEHSSEFMSLLDRKDKLDSMLKNLKMRISLGKMDGSEIQGIKTSLTGQEHLLGYFLRMHKALKRCRNTINHGDSVRPDFEQMKILLKLYVAYGEALYRVADQQKS